MSDVYALHRGSRPLVVSIPHVGTAIPQPLHAALDEDAVRVHDTDWHLDRLYDFVRERGASLIVPRLSRYVIDLNRPGDDTPMYTRANNTELCPTRSFGGRPLYRDGHGPDRDEIARRRALYWTPYHAALSAEIERVRAAHGHAVLFDAHSIRSVLPWLFEGKLSDLNLGTVEGTSCAPALRESLSRLLAAQSRYSHVVDGRFKGGHITRHYGRPASGVHAVQLEMCWSCYMDERPPYVVDEARARTLRATVLEPLVDAMLAFRPDVR
jgi:N-formylglutamate deformylase